MDQERESAILRYIGLGPEDEPRPSTSPIEFLRKYLHVLPPHLIVDFSFVTTPRQRSKISEIRNRRVAYTETKPKELMFANARRRWGGQPGEGEEERAWAETEFMGGGTQQVGKLAALLAGYEEEREGESRTVEDVEETPGEFERRIRELFIDGMLEGADYDLVDWSEQYDVEDECSTYFDA